MAHDLRFTPVFFPPTRICENGAGLLAEGGTIPPLLDDDDAIAMGLVDELFEFKLNSFSSFSSNSTDLSQLQLASGEGSKFTLVPSDERSQFNLVVSDEELKFNLSARPTSSLGLSGEGRGGEKGKPSFDISLGNQTGDGDILPSLLITFLVSLEIC